MALIQVPAIARMLSVSVVGRRSDTAALVSGTFSNIQACIYALRIADKYGALWIAFAGYPFRFHKQIHTKFKKLTFNDVNRVRWVNS